MAQRHSLNQKQVGKQTISPQMRLFAHLLKMTTNDLEEEIKKELEDNPALAVENPQTSDFDESPETPFEEHSDSEDITSELSLNDTLLDDSTSFLDESQYEDDYDFQQEREYDYKTSINNYSADDHIKERDYADKITLQEHLLAQVSLFNLNEEDAEILKYLIGNLDDNGFFHLDNKTFSFDIWNSYNIKKTPEEIEWLITTYLHKLDPAGIGARNLRECFLIQLQRRQPTCSVKVAIHILEQYYTEFTKKNYEKILVQLNISKAELQNALSEITNLDPKPGFSSTTIEEANDLINPDFFLTIEGDQLKLSLNTQFIPKLIINPNFKKEYRYLNTEKNIKMRNEAERFLKEKIDHAQTLIDVLSQREMTMYRIVYEIIEFQKAYFLFGNNENMIPMKLADIAEKLEIDISTVSRVSANKYIDTPFGTIALKQLFSESIGDGDVSSIKVKQLIYNYIDNEDKTSPYTDDQICQYLHKNGYNIARRTVTKYREQLLLPVARMRK
ncbi:MAG: RNA polymerase factor sigma-54 [Bacteroidales bacterium]|jgi:RNA polymerase sigma-54 factor|nr:RNA polymerase factor sigma-54 [Bacteroidales bacterium]